MTDADPVCWYCQQPGAECTNARGEPVHRDCLNEELAAAVANLLDPTTETNVENRNP